MKSSQVKTVYQNVIIKSETNRVKEFNGEVKFTHIDKLVINGNIKHI